MDLKLTVFPGEAALVAFLEYAKVARATMSKENIDRWDAHFIGVAEDWRAFWKKAVDGGETK